MLSPSIFRTKAGTINTTSIQNLINGVGGFFILHHINSTQVTTNNAQAENYDAGRKKDGYNQRCISQWNIKKQALNDILHAHKKR